MANNNRLITLGYKLSLSYINVTFQTRSEFLVGGPKISSYCLIHDGVMRITDRGICFGMLR